jgi:hypothetical protein
MGKISTGRLIVGGLIIGALTNIGYALVMAWLLLWPWKGALAAIGRPPFWINEVLILLGLGFVAGFGAAWIYAGVRPRFGAGPRTRFMSRSPSGSPATSPRSAFASRSAFPPTSWR